jgi:putative ABC transport system permease protein
VADLTLARAAARDREMAIRAAIGAGRRRLLRRLATESLVLAAAGGALGLLLAMWAVDLMPAILETRLPRGETVRIDRTVLFAALAATLLTSVVFGTAPALQARGDTGALKDTGRTGTTGSTRSRKLRRGIVVVEVALSVMVIVGAGLLVRSFVTLRSRDPGFAPANLLSFMVHALPDQAARGRTAGALVERLSQLQGVEAAGAATGLPVVTPQRATQFEIEGRTLTPAESQAYFIAATPGYFRALRAPVLSGRAIDGSDRAGAPATVVINRMLASQLFPGQDPVGRRVRLGFPEYSSEWRTIVGVVGDVRYRGLAGDARPAIYTPFEQTPFMWLFVMVRTAADPSAVVRSLRAIVREVDPSLTAANVRQMTEVVSGTMAQPRLGMLLLSAFAALALVLAAVGIYGVIAYSVAQRTREIGLRMALGAERSDVLTMVVREAALVAALGVSGSPGRRW